MTGTAITPAVTQPALVWPMPASESLAWPGTNFGKLFPTGTELRLNQPSDPADQKHSTFEDARDRTNVKFAPALTQQALSIAAVAEAPRNAVRPQLDAEAVLILRAKYLGTILTSLEQMQPVARSTQVARYAGEMLDAMTTYIDQVPNDPVVEVVLVVYPALAAENHWADWSAEQFSDLHKVLRDLVSRTLVTAEMVEKAIIWIEEKVGLDTLPFEIDPRKLS